MEQRQEAREKLEKSLSECEARLRKLAGEAKGEETAKELEALEKDLKSCRLEVNELEGKSGDEWLDAQHGVIRRLEDLQRNLQLSQDRLEDYIR